MGVRVIQSPMQREELAGIAKEGFGDMVKAVVDVRQEIMAVGGELHSDEEAVLVEEHASKRPDIWGINIYPKKTVHEWIEFDSMINIKPMYNNRSRDIEDETTKENIRRIVEKLIRN